MDFETLKNNIIVARPSSHWVLTGNTYEGFVWLDDPATKPTAEELGL